MTHRQWTFLNNPFLEVAMRSRTKGITISTYTNGALFERQADPFFGPQYLFYHPLHQAVLDENAELLAQRGTQKGATQTVDNLLNTLSPKKINDWDRMVDAIFNRGTPEFLAVFPQGHKLFQTGGKDERIGAVQALSTKLGEAGAPPGFAAIKLDVDNFLGQLLGKRTIQEGEISQTGTESTEVTQALTAAMTGMYALLGSCMNQFASNPSLIEPIFDLQTIRNLPQTKFIDHVAQSATKNIFKRTLNPTDKVRIKVLSSEALRFYFAEEKNDAPGVISLVVNGLEEEIVDASLLGNVPAAAWLKVINESALVEGHFEVELM